MIEDHALDVAAVPELGGVAAHQVEARRLDVPVVLEADAVHLARVAEGIARGRIVRVGMGKVMEAEVTDEDLVRTASDDLRDARIRGSARERYLSGTHAG